MDAEGSVDCVLLEEGMNSVKSRGEPVTFAGSMETFDFLIVRLAAGSAMQTAAAMYRSGLLRPFSCLVLFIFDSTVFLLVVMVCVKAGNVPLAMMQSHE
jgi:hypothetical protein